MLRGEPPPGFELGSPPPSPRTRSPARDRDTDPDERRPGKFRCVESVEELTAAAVGIDDSLDYSALTGLDISEFNRSPFPADMVAKGKIKDFEVLDHHHVYDVILRSERGDAEMVDTTWAITQNRDQAAKGECKCRLVGRDYRWKSPGREDTYAPMSQPATSRVVDFYSMKVDVDPEDPQVEFEVVLAGPTTRPLKLSA